MCFMCHAVDTSWSYIRDDKQPYKAFENLYKALESLYKALEGLIKPSLSTLQGPQGP